VITEAYWNYVATSQGMLQISNKHQKLREQPCFNLIASRKEPNLLTFLFQTPVLNYKRIIFYSFKLFSL
jgi:hypothetical protein